VPSMTVPPTSAFRSIQTISSMVVVVSVRTTLLIPSNAIPVGIASGLMVGNIIHSSGRVKATLKGQARSNLFDLTRRVAIVTGGGRGLGRTLALGLADFGADVGVAVGHRMDEGKEMAQRIEEVGRRALATPVSSTLAGRRVIRSRGKAWPLSLLGAR